MSRKGNSREHIKGTFRSEHRAEIFVCQGSHPHKCGFDRGRLRPRPFLNLRMKSSCRRVPAGRHDLLSHKKVGQSGWSYADPATGARMERAPRPLGPGGSPFLVAHSTLSFRGVDWFSRALHLDLVQGTRIAPCARDDVTIILHQRSMDVVARSD